MSLPRHTARGVILHNGQLLLIERFRDDLHYFSVPGGGIEAGETPERTVVREIMEETGCQVRLVRKLYLLQFENGADHHIFLCKYESGEPHLPADSPEALERDPDNVFKPRWVAQAEIANTPFLVWEPIKQQLLQDLANGFKPGVLTLREL